MPFYEIVFEQGDFSKANYENDEEASTAIKAQHERAIEGTTGGPSGHAAQRVVKVIRYPDDPGEFNPEMTLSSDVAKSAVTDALKASTEEGVVDLNGLAARIRDLSNPFDENAGPHDSKYRAEGKEVAIEGVTQ